jgi:hypothetical protein
MPYGTCERYQKWLGLGLLRALMGEDKIENPLARCMLTDDAVADLEDATHVCSFRNLRDTVIREAEVTGPTQEVAMGNRQGRRELITYEWRAPR